MDWSPTAAAETKTWRLTRWCTRGGGSFDNLTDDLLAHILLKLPAKSLHRFRCVARRWHSIISSPLFARSHIIKHPPSTLMLFQYNRGCDRQVSGFTLDDAAFLPPPPPPSFEFIPPLGLVSDWMLVQSVALQGSCGGLVLLEVKFQDSGFFYVCNPLTKHWMQLPQLIAKPGRVGFTCYYSGQQPDGTTVRLSANSVASAPSLFNYNPNKIHFTCVLITKEDHFIIYVFHSCSEIAEWRVFHVPFPFGYTWAAANGRDPALFSNGVFLLDGVNSIAAYDPFNSPNHCHIIPLPPLDFPKDSHPVLDRFMGVTSEGCLRMGMNFISGIFVVWELVDYANKTWALKYTINVKYPGHHRAGTWFHSFTGVSGDEACLVDNKNLTIIIFNLRTRSLQPVYSLPVETRLAQYFLHVQPCLLSSWPLLQHLAYKLPLSCSMTLPDI